MIRRSGAEQSATALYWSLIGGFTFLVLPWYAVEDGFFSFAWLVDGWVGDRDFAPGLFQGLLHEKWWLLPLILPLATALLAVWRRDNRLLLASGIGGLALLLLQAFAIYHRGWAWPILELLFGPLDGRQFGIGWGGAVTALAFLFITTTALAGRGMVRGDAFVAGAIGLVVAMVSVFIIFPVSEVLLRAVEDRDGSFSLAHLVANLTDSRIWSLGCLTGGGRCGTAWNSFFLATIVGVSTTLLGLAFALVATRTNIPAKRHLRQLTLLPIITPPFVVGLAIILLFGRSGTVTQFVA
ncbi:MAG: iron ABC transporter permease, partial [Pseudomonadota bacterium]